MREFPLNLQPYFRTGLRPDYRADRNRVGLTSCMNLQPSQNGLVAYEPLALASDRSNLLLHGLDIQWPNPKLMHGKKHSIIANADNLYYLHAVTGNIVKLDLYDFYNSNNVSSVQIGTDWQFADAGDSWLAVNGACAVVRTNWNLALLSQDKIYVVRNFGATSAAWLKGRFIMGGFLSDTLAATGYGAYWYNKSQASLYGIDDLPETRNYLTGNTVWWSSIGGGDLFTLFSSLYGEFGFISAAYEATLFNFVFDMLRKNEWGYAPMKWQGLVRSIVASKEFAVVYGDGGVTGLFTITEPMSQLGTREILPIGVLRGSAACSNGKEQIFLDQEGELWLVKENLEAEMLGFKEHFQNMVGTDVVISYEPSNKRFYICNGFRAFTLDHNGLSENKQLVTSAAFAYRPICLGADPNLINETWEVFTDSFDMSNRSGKNISFVEIAGEIDSTTQGCLQTRFKSTDDWYQTSWVTLYDNHFHAGEVAGVEFRLGLKGDNFRNIRIEGANIRWQQSDKRFVRGAYQANPSLAGAGE